MFISASDLAQSDCSNAVWRWSNGSGQNEAFDHVIFLFVFYIMASYKYVKRDVNLLVSRGSYTLRCKLITQDEYQCMIARMSWKLCACKRFGREPWNGRIWEATLFCTVVCWFEIMGKNFIWPFVVEAGESPLAAPRSLHTSHSPSKQTLHISLESLPVHWDGGDPVI